MAAASATGSSTRFSRRRTTATIRLVRSALLEQYARAPRSTRILASTSSSAPVQWRCGKLTRSATCALTSASTLFTQVLSGTGKAPALNALQPAGSPDASLSSSIIGWPEEVIRQGVDMLARAKVVLTPQVRRVWPARGEVFPTRSHGRAAEQDALPR